MRISPICPFGCLPYPETYHSNLQGQFFLVASIFFIHLWMIAILGTLQNYLFKKKIKNKVLFQCIEH
jgi:hypothetical protein